MYRRTVLAGVGTIALGSGCLGSTTEASADRTLDRLRERTDRVESVAGRVSTETVVGGHRTRERTFDVWSVPGRGLRQESVDESSRLIADGSETWLYRPRTNRAVHLSFSVDGADPFTYRSLVDDLDGYDVDHRGRTEVAGRTADSLDCTPPDGGPELEYYTFSIGPELNRDAVLERIELWVDREYGYPLARTIHTADGRASATFEDVRFQQEIPEEQFAFEPPSDVEVRNDEAIGSRHATIDGAQAHGGFRIGAPERVAGHELEYATVAYYEHGTSITAHYDGQLSVRARPTDSPDVTDELDRVETVSLGEVDATVVRLQKIAAEVRNRDPVTYQFRCDGLDYVVNGLSDVAVRTAAEAVACE